MDTSNDNTRTTALDQDLIVLGVASLDTQGGPLAGEEMGGTTTLGISQD
ncbi:benenodin family lasso peptide [Xanthomonas sp. NCPPB 1325]